MKNVVKLIAGCLPTLAIAVAIWASMRLGLIPPEQKTESDMQALFLRIENYTATNGHSPSTLADLDGQPDSKYCDAWGVPFEYIPQRDGSIVLKSLGARGENNIRILRFSMVNRTDASEWKAAGDTVICLLHTERQIRNYVMVHRELPLNLTHFLYSTDGWGTMLSYDVAPDHHVRLTSYGKPGTTRLFSLEFSVPELAQP